MKNLILATLLLTGSAYATFDETELKVCTKKSTLAAIENGSAGLSNVCGYYCENAGNPQVRQIVNSLSNYRKDVFESVCDFVAAE